MDTKIIMDSCIDFNDEVFDNERIMERIPFKIIIDEEEIIDLHAGQNELIIKMKNSKNKIATSCPSPHEFLEAFRKCKNNFVVTISEKLSGSHNSAMLAKEMLKEESPESFVHVFDCKTAAAGASLVILKLKQLIEEKLNIDQIIEEINTYIDEMKTFLLAERLDNLAKNGRISSQKAFIGNLLQVVPIMCSNGNGELILKEQVRGRKKALNRLIDIIGEEGKDIKNKVVGITHVNCIEKAECLKSEIANKYDFKDIVIFDAGGLSTIYADDGGIVVCY
ncbi:DegV domain-containing protein [Clostridium puniceum]|uniref:DegV domain-containing protein n=1 Tax=Clostridium puniceum TaxID=29367 RepID=A0A1S8TXW0_9CLOT|nr:DegV family protein [Clostridium puniceum]OOM82537.1 DegV domain-containing protein [Clostridium puniceum]